MKKQIERRICDECGKTVDQSEMTIGGSPFHGWLEVVVTDGSTMLPRRGLGNLDFCCNECAVTFLKSVIGSKRVIS